MHGRAEVGAGQCSILLATARTGDAVLCHYLLGHGAAGNASPFIRYGIFFRLTHKNQENWRWESMIDPWLGWAGMREVAILKP